MPPLSREARASISAHTVRIQRFFAAKGLSPEEAEDLAQDVLLAALEGFGRFRGNSSLGTWIYAICRNVYRTHSYRLARARKLVDRYRADAEDREVDATAVRSIVESMPVQLQTVYLLYYERGLSVRETGQEINRPEGTVKYLLSELRRRFRVEWT